MSIEDHVASMRKAINDDISRGTDIVFKGLVEQAPINAIPESLFVRYFLPCFTGQVNNANWVLEWVGIAGTPMSEVNVFKDGTNEVLFRVPGILASKTLLLEKRYGDLGDIFTRYEQIKSNIPSAGMRFMTQALNQTNKELLQKYNSDDTKRAWYHILTRYNLIAPIAKIESSSNESEDYFDY